MKILIALLSCSVLLVGCSSNMSNVAKGQSDPGSKFGVGLGVGTTGATVEVKYAPNDVVALRGSFNVLSVEADAEYNDIFYEGETDITTVGGFVDVAPFKNGFVLSGGAFMGDKTLDLEAVPAVNVQIGDQTFTPSEIGTLSGQAEFANFAPYAGLGYDGFIAGSKNWSFNARAGIMFIGAPNVDLVSANGSLSNNPLLREELDEENLDNIKYYPVVSLGIARRF